MVKTLKHLSFVLFRKEGAVAAAGVLTLIFSLILILTFSGCGKKQPETGESALNINQAAESLFNIMEAFCVRIEDEIAKEAYGLDKSEFEDLSLYKAGADTNSAMIAIIRAKDSGNLARGREALKAFHEMNLAAWNNYLPLEYIKVENYIIIEKGLYLFYIVSDRQDELRQAVEGLF